MAGLVRLTERAKAIALPLAASLLLAGAAAADGGKQKKPVAPPYQPAALGVIPECRVLVAQDERELYASGSVLACALAMVSAANQSPGLLYDLVGRLCEGGVQDVKIAEALGFAQTLAPNQAKTFEGGFTRLLTCSENEVAALSDARQDAINRGNTIFGNIPPTLQLAAVNETTGSIGGIPSSPGLLIPTNFGGGSDVNDASPN